MTVATYTHLSPELGPSEIDTRSVNVFCHGYPSPLIRWHFHDEYELHLIVAGTGKVFVGDHVSSFSPGQLVMTGPHLPHNWMSHVHPDDVIDMRDYVVQFRQNLIQSLTSGAPELKGLIPLLERASLGIEFYGPVCAETQIWFEKIINEKGAGRIGLLIEILERLSREQNYQTLSTVPLVSGKGITKVKKLKRAILHTTEYHATDIQLESIASIVGMSKNSFSHFFKKSTGYSFINFLNRVRIAHACELLNVSSKPITEICHTVGYNNVANFNRRFRELKGVTPSRYRENNQLVHFKLWHPDDKQLQTK